MTQPPNSLEERHPTADDLIDAYLDAFRLGTAPSPEAFIAAHPEHRDELEADLPLILRLEHLSESHHPNPSATLPLPMVLDGEFRLERHIGTGGMGSVYAAVQLSLNRPCAVKILSRSLNAHPEERERFRRESELIAKLRHPNIIEVLRAGTCDGLSYYAMDLVEGPPPKTFCSSQTAVARIGLQLANALAYAHSFGIVHCDIKPSNILTEADGTVRLGDFGLSRSLGDPAGDSGGTLRYMPPERLRKEPFTEAADQYALGITLRELLGDTCLKDLEPAALKKRILSGRLPDMPEVPADLAAIIGKLTAFEPTRRYTSMHRAAEDLANFLEHRPIVARHASLSRRLLLWTRRRPAVAAVSVLALLCAGCAVAALAIGYRNTAEAHRRAEQARLRAEHSADVANKTLIRVLSHAINALPTKAGARFLNDLLPYYDDLAERQTLSEDTLRMAYATIGTAALRSGQPSIALEIFGRLKTLEDSSVTNNSYAASLYGCGRTEEARATDRETVRRHAKAPDSESRLQALIALQRLAKNNPNYRRQLNDLQNTLHRDIPHSAEFRLLVANALLFFPETVSRACRPYPERSDVSNARSLLISLSRQRLSPRYDAALIQLAGNYLRHLPPGTAADSEFLIAALTESGRVLGRWLGDSGVSNAVIGFWLELARYLRSNGNNALYKAFTNRLYGILDVLYYNEETPDEARDFLLHMLLSRLETACAAEDAADIHLRNMQLKEKLGAIAPNRAPDIRKRADELLRDHPYTFAGIDTRLQPEIDFSLDCSFFAPAPFPEPVPPKKSNTEAKTEADSRIKFTSASSGKGKRRHSMMLPLIPAQKLPPSGTPHDSKVLQVFDPNALPKKSPSAVR